MVTRRGGRRRGLGLLEILGGLSLTVALVAATAGGCRAEGKNVNDRSKARDEERPVTRAKEPPANLTDLANEVGLTFPASARLIGVSREAGMDDAVMLKVEIASKDLAAFTKTCPVPPEAFGPGSGGLLGPDDGFWDPHHAVHLRSGQKILANHRTLNVGIADGGGDVVWLYIVNHGT